MFGEISKLMNYFIQQVGFRGDVSNEVGSLHAKLAAMLTRIVDLGATCSASSNVKYSADAERSVPTTTVTKVKEIQMGIGGVVRVAFDLHGDSGRASNGYIYKNGVSTGISFSETSTTYVTRTADLAVTKGDLVQLWIAEGTLGYGAYCRNFRICYDVAPVGGVKLN